MPYSVHQIITTDNEVLDAGNQYLCFSHSHMKHLTHTYTHQILEVVTTVDGTKTIICNLVASDTYYVVISTGSIER